jgi:hypothetical protein
MNGRFNRVPNLIPGLIGSHSERAQMSDSGLDSDLHVSVVFTTKEGTLTALRAASELSKDLSARVTLIVAEVVPFHFPLEKPPVSIDFLGQRQLSLVAESSIHAKEVRIEICLCRDRMQCLKAILKPRSMVVIGREKGCWATQEGKLAHLLCAQGHQVMLVDVATGHRVRHFLTMFCKTVLSWILGPFRWGSSHQSNSLQNNSIGEFPNESRNLASGNVSFGHRRDGAVLTVPRWMRKDMRSQQ